MKAQTELRVKVESLPQRTADAPRRRIAQRAANGVAWCIHRAAWRMRLLEYGWPLVDKELASTVKVPWRARLGMWRRGFLGESWVLYDLARNDWHEYLSDGARFARTRLVNGSYAVLLDDKAAFHRFLGTFQGYLPAFHGTVARGAVATPHGEVPAGEAAGWLQALAARHGRLVLKPTTGGGGRGFIRIDAHDCGLRLNGRPLGADALEDVLAGCDGYMVSEHVAQHPELARPYPATTNTLRILTMQDETCAPFIAAAVLRVGSRRSEPTDNWTRGGLSAAIDPETGRVGRAACYPAHGYRLVWHIVHPESGAAIAGVAIPNWQHMIEDLLAVARSLPMLRYVGWDLVVTEDGFRILEGNNFSDVNLLQIHGPLLRDRRVAAFFRRHGVAPGR